MQIWPAIDIRAGKCVRLAQGDYDRETVYGDNPADMAHRWEADGGYGLHVVDLDGARDGKRINRDAIVRVVNEVSIPCQLGGGIRDETTIADYLEIGIDRLVIGTKAITEPDWFDSMAEKYPNRLLVGIDARDGKVSTDGWKKTTDVTAMELAQKLASRPIAGIIYTDIAKDGMLSGPNFAAMKEMRNALDVPLTCSGGVTTIEDIEKLSRLSLAGCIVGRALYEGRLTLQNALAAASGAPSS